MMEKKEVPIYVKVDDYKDVLEIMELIKQKILETKEVLQKLNELKNAEDSELDAWGNEIEEVERKMAFIDRTLFEPQDV